MKFLLQIASSFVDAFTELLGVYEEIGQRLPLVARFEKLFHKDPNMQRVLGYLYKDILEFHCLAWKYFQQSMWRQLFQATWKTYKARFQRVIDDIDRHGKLIESQAMISQIEATETNKIMQAAQMQSILDGQESQYKIQEAQLQSIRDADESRRLRDLQCWLRAPNVENDQRFFSGIRAEYPGTGRWLLDNSTFKDWFQPLCCILPPLLWLNGIPGAGKTILASLVVEEVQNLSTTPIVLYFYCKHGDNERDNFISMGRSLLSQLLAQNRDILLPYYFDKFSKSPEAVLVTQATIEELLDIAIRNCPIVYIVIDGIDECPRKERDTVTAWFRQLVESLPSTNSDQIRCLFVSQDDGVARKDFADMTALKIQTEDSKNDIAQFSQKWAAKIQAKFATTSELRQAVASKIQDASGGMFLLAKLISTNLFHQTNVDRLEYELDPHRFPKEINHAYSRIMDRVIDQASEPERCDSRMLLSWLVCAKRALKWHEIQGAKSIHVGSQSVDFSRRRFVVGSKDLCGSLVEIRPDMTVELIHMTARTFLISEQHVNQPKTELDLASLCVNYLNFPALTKHSPPNLQRLVLDGHFGFMEYAVVYWIRHLETALVLLEGDNPNKTEDIAQSLEVFMDLHYTKLRKAWPVSSGNERRLQPLERTMSSYTDFQQAVISARKQLTFYGELNSTETALDLCQVVERVRGVIEDLLESTIDRDELEQRLEQSYGSNLFKCPRLSCRYFSNGFGSKDQRDQHLDKHTRPFHCKVVGCVSFTLGFSSERDLEKHVSTSHPIAVAVHEEDEFPDDEDVITASSRSTSPETAPAIQPKDNPAPERPNQGMPLIESGDPPPWPKKRKQHVCQHCNKIFSRKFNYNSHLLTHGVRTEETWECDDCDKSFPRKSDWTRHRLGHADSTRFACGDGQSWGCGKAFARKDTLANHHKSKAGQRCLAAFQAPEAAAESHVP